MDEFLASSPLFRLLTKPRILQDVLKKSLENQGFVVIVSTVCPPYSTDKNGRPTYQGLNCGIEHNIRQHLIEVPKGVSLLKNRGVKIVHCFLMADTEVDLLPFLKKISLTSREFTRRCQLSVEKIAQEMRMVYPEVDYKAIGIPRAARFLKFFGHGRWYETYEDYKGRLLSRAKNDPRGKIARSLGRDAEMRSRIIESLLGPTDRQTRIEHIARQKAQYMAFARLMRDRFEGRLIVVNHQTPNFEWMNDQLVRLHPDQRQTKMGNYLPKIPLLELNISTVPGE